MSTAKQGIWAKEGREREEATDRVRSVFEAITEGTKLTSYLPLNGLSPERREELAAWGVSELLTHDRRKCNRCVNTAFALAVAALGWGDGAAQRPPPDEARRLLQEQLLSTLTWMEEQDIAPESWG